MSSEFSVVANFYIDTEERFLRLKDSYHSFCKSNILSWHINIRGNLKQEVQNFLQNEIDSNKLKTYFLETNNGWIKDTEKITENLKSEIIFFWIEDHLCIKESNIINEIVSEIHQNKIDHLMYSFYHKGDLLKQLKLIPHNKKNFISYADLSFENYEKIKLWHLSNNIIPDYLISLCSFMSLEFLKRNLQVSKHNKKYNKMLPFNFEKSFKEKEIIPFKAGFLNKELFVSIDDDHGEKGYSLISRGLYQNRKTKAEMDMIRNKKIKIYKESIIRKIIKKLNIFK